MTTLSCFTIRLHPSFVASTNDGFTCIDNQGSMALGLYHQRHCRDCCPGDDAAVVLHTGVFRRRLRLRHSSLLLLRGQCRTGVCNHRRHGGAAKHGGSSLPASTTLYHSSWSTAAWLIGSTTQPNCRTHHVMWVIPCLERMIRFHQLVELSWIGGCVREHA